MCEGEEVARGAEEDEGKDLVLVPSGEDIAPLLVSTITPFLTPMGMYAPGSSGMVDTLAWLAAARNCPWVMTS